MPAIGIDLLCVKRLTQTFIERDSVCFESGLSSTLDSIRKSTWILGKALGDWANRSMGNTLQLRVD